MKTSYPTKKISKSNWLRNDTSTTLMLARQMKLEQALIDMIYKAQDSLEMPMFKIRESLINAMQDVEIQTAESRRIKEALS